MQHPKNFCFKEKFLNFLSTHTGLPKTLWALHSWKYSKATCNFQGAKRDPSYTNEN